MQTPRELSLSGVDVQVIGHGDDTRLETERNREASETNSQVDLNSESDTGPNRDSQDSIERDVSHHSTSSLPFPITALPSSVVLSPLVDLISPSLLLADDDNLADSPFTFEFPPFAFDLTPLTAAALSPSLSSPAKVVVSSSSSQTSMAQSVLPSTKSGENDVMAEGKESDASSVKTRRKSFKELFKLGMSSGVATPEIVEGISEAEVVTKDEEVEESGQGEDQVSMLSEEATTTEEEDDGDEEEEEEEEDPDTHPLYTLLSTSSFPALRSTWETTTLILVPPRRTLPSFLALDRQSKGFEFVKGGGGKEEVLAVERPPLAANLPSSSSTLPLSTSTSPTFEALVQFITLHAFRRVEVNQREMWRSIGHQDGRRVQARLEKGRLAYIEMIEDVAQPVMSPTSIILGEAGAMKIDIIPASPRPFVSTSLPSPTSAVATRALQIVAESTIYRRSKTTATTTSTPPLPSPAKPSSSSSKSSSFPKWLRRGSSKELTPISTSNSSTSLTTTILKPVLEKVRVIAVDGEIMLSPFGSSSLLPSGSSSNDQMGLSDAAEVMRKKSRSKGGSSSTSVNRTHSTGTSGKRLARAGSGNSARSVGSGKGSEKGSLSLSSAGGDGARDFISDLAFLASPPASFSPSGAAALSNTFGYVQSLVRDFELSFVYIKGFDVYTVQRIRRGILEKSWNYYLRELNPKEERSVAEEVKMLYQVFENVVLGLLHAKIYVTSIMPLLAPENARWNQIVDVYHRNTSLTPRLLGVDVSSLDQADSLILAIAALKRLCKNSVMIDEATRERLGVCDRAKLTRWKDARPPLMVISIVRETIGEILAAVERETPGSRVAPDDLIPLLAFVIIKADVRDVESLTHFVKSFRLSDGLASELDWSFVTFQAAIAFIRSDPLTLVATSVSPTLLPSLSLALQLPSQHRRASELPSFRPRPVSFHSYPSPEFNPPISRPSSPSSTRSTTSRVGGMLARGSSNVGGGGVGGGSARSLAGLGLGITATPTAGSSRTALRGRERRTSADSSGSSSNGSAIVLSKESVEIEQVKLKMGQYGRRGSLGIIMADLSPSTLSALIAQSTTSDSTISSSLPTTDSPLDVKPRIILYSARSTSANNSRSNSPLSWNDPSSTTDVDLPRVSRAPVRTIGGERASLGMKRSGSVESSRSVSPGAPSVVIPSNVIGKRRSWSFLGNASARERIAAGGQERLPVLRPRRSSMSLLNLGRTQSLPFDRAASGRITPETGTERLEAILANRSGRTARPISMLIEPGLEPLILPPVVSLDRTERQSQMRVRKKSSTSSLRTLSLYSSSVEPSLDRSNVFVYSASIVT